MAQTLVDNRYTCSRPLGSGGMADVYLAHDEVLDRDVALKVLKDQYAGNEEFVRLFRREARSAAALNHPNIVSVYDQGRSEDGTYYMAMEYVPGGTLKDRVLGEGALDPDAASTIASQIGCSAIYQPETPSAA
jgi:serine/threonine protein kinase